MALILPITCVTGCVVPEGSRVGDKATDFNLSTIDGQDVHLRAVEGKPVMISFWTTRCVYCIYQMPFLQEAQETLNDKILFIEIDIAENSYTVKQCLDYYGFNVSVALDSDGKAATAYNIIKTPTNIVIDSKGVIQRIKIGAFLSKDEVLTALSDVK